MKQTLMTVAVFIGAILFFCWITGIASEVHANGFNWPKIVQIAKGEDNMIWAFVPGAFVLGLVGYFIYNR
jgi:hypothetical protein